jgi:hypothetical protein
VCSDMLGAQGKLPRRPSAACQSMPVWSNAMMAEDG